MASDDELVNKLIEAIKAGKVIRIDEDTEEHDCLEHENDPSLFPINQEVTDVTATVLFNEMELAYAEGQKLARLHEIKRAEFDMVKGKLFMRIREILGRETGNVGFREFEGKRYMVAWD